MFALETTFVFSSSSASFVFSFDEDEDEDDAGDWMDAHFEG